MTTYFVSRHSGAVEWARRRGIEARWIEHLDVSLIQAGDTVLGTLPVNLVADINERGARYFHLTMNVPQEMRGKDLSADEMEFYGAGLELFYCQRAGQDAGNKE